MDSNAGKFMRPLSAKMIELLRESLRLELEKKTSSWNILYPKLERIV